MKQIIKFKRELGLRRSWILIGLVTMLTFLACHLSPNSSKDTFDIAGDSIWTSCDSVTVLLLDDSGKTLATLFNDTLRSLNELKQLSAEKYQGGKGKIYISGRKDGKSCFEESRSFDGTGGKVVVDTMLSPVASILSVEVTPHTKSIFTDDSTVSLSASIRPSYAEQSFMWSIDNDSMATLLFPNGPGSGKIKVKLLRAGTARIRARSAKDSSKMDIMTLTIQASVDARVSLLPDSILLYVGGPSDSLKSKVLPEGSDQGLDWSSSNPKTVEVDNHGRISPKGEGDAYITARSKSLGVSDSTYVLVKRDLPTLTVTSRSGAAVNIPIGFVAKATQEFGSIVLYGWDLDGNGEWDDSLKGPWTGNSVILPAVFRKYAKEGSVIAKFMVRDGEGNVAFAQVALEIGNQAPEILKISADTTISIKDSISLIAKVKDFEGKVAGCAWDYEGDGKFDDSITTNDSVVDFVFGHRYLTAGNFNAILGVKDEQGKSRRDTVHIKVILDPPVADAGNDTTVMAGTLVNIQAKGTDKYGSIAKREIQVGAGSFISLSKQDTTARPPVDSGKFNVIVRVTDDDGNKAVDTMVVTISTPSKSNADLAELTASKGTLAPTFKPITTLYSLPVAFADSQITVKAVTSDSGAKLAINGKPNASGVSSEPVGISVGTTINVFQLVVTAQDGLQKIYGISVTRAPSAEAQLSKLEGTGISIKPEFAPATLDYADTVANAVTSITLKPTVSSAGAKVAVNDSTLPSGTVTNPLPVKVGDNLIKIVVTAQDGKVKATYNVKVVRRAKVIVTRKLGDSTSTQTDSIEAPLGGTVTISSPTVTGFHFTKWTFSEGSGTVADSMVSSTLLTLKSATVRVQAVFAINVYTLVTSTGPGGIFTPPSGIINHGDGISVTVSPLSGYRVLTLTDNGKDIFDAAKKSSFKYTLSSVTENHVLAATFIRIYTLTAVSNNPAKGTITPGPLPLIVDSGANQSFNLKTLVVGQYADSLIDNGSNLVASLTGDPTDSSKYSLTGIKNNHSISANFALRTFPISAKAEVGGTILPSDTSVGYGGNVTIVITPSEGYRFLALTDNAKDVSQIALDGKLNYVLSSVTGKHDLVATFMKTYNLTTTVTGSGTITPLGKVVVDAGASQVYNLVSSSPKTGVYASSVVDNGKDFVGSLGGDPMNASTYTLNSINEDHIINVAFMVKSFNLTVIGKSVTAIETGPFFPCLMRSCPTPPDSLTIKVPYGVSYTIRTADSSGGQPFVSWSGGPPTPTLVSGVSTSTVILTSADMTYRAYYKPILISCCKLGICCTPVPILPPILIGSPLASP